MKVEGPDGQIYEFPEDATQDEIVGFFSSRAPAQTVPQPDPRKEVGTAAGALGQFGQGLSFGFIDELRGLAEAGLAKAQGVDVPFGELYRESRDIARGEQERFAEENPVLSGAANLGGGLVTGIATGGLLAGTAPGRAVAQGMRAATPMQRAAMAVPVGAAGGAAGGALAGAGQAETLADIPGQALIDAAMGAAIGGLMGPAGEGLATAGQKLIGAAGRRLAPSAEDRAAAEMRKALERQGMTPQDAMGRVAALGPGATLADVGESTRGLLDAMAAQPGATAQAAGRQLARRSRSQIGELTDAIGEGRAFEAIEASKAARSSMASPLYDQAFARGVPHTEVLEDLFSRPTVVKAWNAAKRRGQDVSGIDPERLGEVRPSLEGWQAIKESLDDRVSSLNRAGKVKQAREIQESILDPMLAELDAANPDYAQARAIWAGSKAFDDAVESGRKFVNEPSSVTERALQALTPSESEAYKIGAVQGIQDMLERQGWTHDATRRFRTPAMERKLRALLGPEEFADFMNRLEASRVKQQTFGLVGKGSQTAARTAAREDETMATALRDFGVDVLTGQSPTASAIQRGATFLRDLPVGGTPEAARDLIGQALLETDPQAMQRGLLQAYAPRQPVPTTGAGLLPFVAGVPVGAGLGLLSTNP